MKLINRGQPKQALGGFSSIVLALATIVLALALTGLIAAFTLNIQDSVDDSFTANSLEWNASDSFKEGITNISDQAGNIGLVAAAVVVISLLVIGFGGLLASRRR